MTPERLRDLRKQSGMTQKQLADALGYERGYYSQIEAGIHPMNCGFYLRAVRKMLKRVENLAKLLDLELKTAICQEERC